MKTQQWSRSDLIDQYIKSGHVCYEATLKGDYRRNNREYRTIINVFKYLEHNLPLAEETLPLLFKDENVVVKTKAAAHCLALKIHIPQAEQVLKDVANDSSTGIFGFNAEMTLKVWHEQGYLKVYQK